MRKILIIACILLLANELIASENSFDTGYVVLESGDTLMGYVETNTWRINPTTVTFTSSTINNDTITYPLSAIKSFFTSNFVFIKRFVKIDQQINDINDLEDYPQSPFREDTVLLELLVGGEANLYSYKEANGRMHYYIESKVAELQELLNTMYKVKSTTGYEYGKSYVGYSKEYKIQLLTSLVGCKAITYNDINIVFKQSALIKLVELYNQCMAPNGSIIYKKNVEKWQSKPYLSVGITIATTKFKSKTSIYYSLENTDFTTSFGFSGSFGILYIAPKHDEKLSLYTELCFSHYKFTTKDYVSISNLSSQLEYKYAQMAVNFGLQYKLSNKLTDVYLRAGISPIFSFLFSSKRINYLGSSSSSWIDFKNFQFGLDLGIGYDFSRVAIEYQFLVSSGISPYLNLKNIPITNYFLVRFLLGNKNDLINSSIK